MNLQHIEFFDIEHFEVNYNRVYPQLELSVFIDFFWETKFELLFQRHPNGFSDALFPNIGYTYLINLGTPFIMQVGEQRFDMKGDGFLPRDKAIECFHSAGNKLFGIKLKVSPALLEKKIDFSEYREFIFPLSYILDQQIIDKVKKAITFNERVTILTRYFQHIVKQNSGSLRIIQIVTKILDHCIRTNKYSIPVRNLARQYNISTRSLQRYFEMTTGTSTKQALQILRIRKATQHLAHSPENFHYSLYGYYDRSHFYKHLKRFLQKSTLQNIRLHLKLLDKMHR